MKFLIDTSRKRTFVDLHSPATDDILREDAKKVMVYSAEDLVGWSDFPKGLRVLLLHQDGPSATEVKSKLEEMNYIVFLFRDENKALEAISNTAENFHVAMVEVTAGNQNGHIRFLEMVRGLPTIMISESHCLSTMMQCIALGAAEFLEKPISEERLRNIWQHVVHKAFNAGGSALSKSLKPIKETVVSMLGLNADSGTNGLFQNQSPSCVQLEETHYKTESEDSVPVPNDQFPAPSTPQLAQGGRLTDDGDCQEQPNCSIEESKEQPKGLVEPRGFSSKLRTSDETCNNLIEKFHEDDSASTTPIGLAAEEEVDSADGSKTQCSAANKSFPSSSHLENKEHIDSSAKENKASMKHGPKTYTTRTNKKKMKVDWTPELHRRFVQAVEQLGTDEAIPSKILELMKVEGLTRHNVASHLQKYRTRRRHVFPKDEDRRWQRHRDPRLRVYSQKPHVALPPILSNNSGQPSQAYPVWGHPSYHPSGIPFWGLTGFPTWQPSPDIWPWKTYPMMHADAWGFPVVPTQSQFPNLLPQNLPQSQEYSVDYGHGESRHPPNIHLAEEIVDMVVKEAIRKPWLPLPLGLKPPSMDKVLAEMQSKGISNIPSLNYTTSPPPHPLS